MEYKIESVAKLLKVALGYGLAYPELCECHYRTDDGGNTFG